MILTVLTAHIPVKNPLMKNLTRPVMIGVFNDYELMDTAMIHTREAYCTETITFSQERLSLNQENIDYSDRRN